MFQCQLREESLRPARWSGPHAPESFAGTFNVRPHPVHPRLKQIDISPRLLAAFFADVRDVDVQNLNMSHSCTSFLPAGSDS